MKIAAIVLASLMLIATFCPWGTVSSSASFGGYGGSFSAGISGLDIASGLIGLLASITAIVLPCINKTRRFSIIPGAIGLLTGIGGFVQLRNADQTGGSFSGSFGGASLSAGVDPSWGIFLFTLCALAYVILSAIMVKKS